MPVQTGGSGNERHLRDLVDYLRKNGSNYKNALVNLKNDVEKQRPDQGEPSRAACGPTSNIQVSPAGEPPAGRECPHT